MTDGGVANRVVVHVDDVGMCHGANAAFLDLMRGGRCDSGSVMVPCPWFQEIVDEAGDRRLDIGVHLTLNAEKPTYRWGPLTGTSRKGGLTDDTGNFWRTVDEVRMNADPSAVEDELRAQIDTAIASGIEVTHIDSHMGTVLAPEFVDLYARLARDYELPLLIPRRWSDYDAAQNFTAPVDDGPHARTVADLEADGFPIMDHVLETPWHRRQATAERYGALLPRVGAGLTFFALHPNAPGEIEAIEPASAAIRTDEYAFFGGEDGAAWLAALPGRRVGMREVRDEFRARRNVRGHAGQPANA